jgi:1-phosphofructokinase
LNGAQLIVTVTLNPSIDRTLRVEGLRTGSVNRVELVRLDAGGKGVNVSRALSAYGADTHAILVRAALGGEWMSEQLTAAGISHTTVPAEGITRSNITLVDADGTVTKLNEPGVTLTPQILASAEQALESLPLAGNWVVFAGALNPGASADTYAQLVSFCKLRGARVVLNLALTAKPDLIKPNQHELGGIVGRTLHTISEIIDAARDVMSRGVGMVLCSLGKDGALLISPEGVVHVEAVTEIVGTPVGAGDILLATFLAGGADVNALKGAVQWSAASVALPGTMIPTPDQAAAIKVNVHTEVELGRKLREVA